MCGQVEVYSNIILNRHTNSTKVSGLIIPSSVTSIEASTFYHCFNLFGFTIIGPANADIVVEACADLANPVWNPVGTNTLTGGSSYFSDPHWTNHPRRFYRFRSP